MLRKKKQRCQEIIEPALINAGWGFYWKIELDPDRINLSKDEIYDPTQKLIADYVLRLSKMPLAIFEVNAEDKSVANRIQ